VDEASVDARQPLVEERRLPKVNSSEFCKAPVRKDFLFYQDRSELETVARCATLAWSQDVCKGSRFTVQGEHCVVSR